MHVAHASSIVNNSAFLLFGEKNVSISLCRFIYKYKTWLSELPCQIVFNSYKTLVRNKLNGKY